jgi:DNA primase large subunit
MKDLKLVFDGDRISYVEYLKLTRTLVVKDSGWKLVNRIMHDGVVELKEGDKKELLAEKIRLRVLSPVDVKLAPAQVISTAEKIKKMLSAVSSEPSENDVSDEANPPCIKNMLFMLKSGNTTHAMMFILGTYFAGKELPEDKIVELFSAFPSFDEKKTRYQLKFLLGERGRTKYNCPSCSKIKSYGLCNGACGIKNPLQYKKRKTT